MNCHDCDHFLHQRLDGLLIDDAAVQEHLTQCARCRQLQQAATLLEDGLRQLPPAKPPVGLQSRIIQQVLAEHQRRVRQQRRLLAAAAVLLLLALPALALLFLPPGEGPAPQPGPVARQVQPQPQHLAEAPSLEKSVEEAARAVTHLKDRLADQTREGLVVLWNAAAPPELPPMGALPTVTEGEHPLEPAVQSLREAGAGVSVGLQTVADSARRAVVYWIRELPVLE